MATFEQERHVELVNGANESFVITSRMVAAIIPDQLPHLNVFVLTVNDVDDPKQDTLARVARIADLTTIPIGRDAGIDAPSADGTQYLSASSTNIYETLETANDAAVAFQDRVNALIEAWITFRTEFNAPDPSPALYTFPRVDATQKEALIAAYKTAKQDRYQKQLDKVEADAELGRAQADYTYKKNLTTDVDLMAAAAVKNQSEMTSLAGGLGSLLVSGNVFLAAATTSPPSAGDKTAFQAALAAATTLQTTSSTYLADAATLTSLITSYQSARGADATAAASTLTTAQSDQITKAQLLTSALTLETAALAAVLAVCPDFDKHSIPFVDDNEP